MPNNNPSRHGDFDKSGQSYFDGDMFGTIVGALISRAHEMKDRDAVRKAITEGFPETPKSSTKKYRKGGKFNPKYTRGSSNVAKRKRLMSEIAAIYKKHRGTKSKRKKKGFPPAVAARLKRLMAQRDKI